MQLETHATRRKAISGVLAGVIFFSMVFTAGLSFILLTFTSFNNYDRGQAAANQAAQAKSAESLLLRSCDGTNNLLPSVAPWKPTLCVVSIGNVGVWVQNTGTIAVSIRGMWILNSTKNSLVPAFGPMVTSTSPTLPSTINPGSTIDCSGTPCVIDTGFKPGSSTDKFSIVFITSTGNQFSATYPPPPLPNALPSITLSPNSGPVGTNVTVTGSYFATSSVVKIAFDVPPFSIQTTIPLIITTNSGGSFSATFVVPPSVAVAHTVRATDGSTNTASAVFTVTSPVIVLSPNGGPYGIAVPVTVTGNGFSPLSTIASVTIDYPPPQTTETTSPVTISTDSTGAFSATFTVDPTIPVGPHTVNVTDVNGLSTIAIYTVTTSSNNPLPFISLNPITGPTGISVRVSGGNFANLSSITIQFDGLDQITIPPSVISSAGGTFVANFTVSSTAVSGPHTVAAFDGAGNSASAVFTVVIPIISLSPLSGPAATNVQVNGGNFAKVSPITIKFDGVSQTTVPPSVNSSAGGTFVANFTVPSTAAAGAYVVTASDSSGGTATAIFIVSCTISSNCVSSSTFGIGYISFNFDTFNYYTLTGAGCSPVIGVYPSSNCILAKQGLAYSIVNPGSRYFVFGLNLTNVDPNKRTLMFDDNDYLQAVLICATTGSSCGSFGGTSAVWEIGCVAGSNIAPLSSCRSTLNGVTGIPLAYGESKIFYFVAPATGNPPAVAGSKWENMEPATPIFIIVHGSLACVSGSIGCVVGSTQLFGENIPFTSIFWNVGGASSTISVTCTPSTITTLTSSTCTATATPISATGTVTWSSASSTGTFTPLSCNLSGGSCTVAYRDTTVGTFLITASYSGDSNNQPSSSSTSVKVISSATQVGCSPPSVLAGKKTVCTAVVSGASPTGTVTFSSSVSGTAGFTAGTGTFTAPSTCTLSGGTCSVTYTQGATGTVTITASYGGDANNPGSSGTTLVTFTSATSVNCSPATVLISNPTVCTAVVSGASPTGTVTFSSSVGTGTFTPATTCTLSGGTCSVTYTQGATGTVTITASYGGDANNPGSSGTTLVTFNPTSTTTVSCGSVLLTGSNRHIVCTATVVGITTPTGAVAWSAICVVAGNFCDVGASVGIFTPASGICTLSFVSATSSSCQIDWKVPNGSFSGTIQVSAAYLGDATNSPSSGQTTVLFP